MLFPSIPALLLKYQYLLLFLSNYLLLIVLDFDLAKSVGEYFRLNNNQMDEIINQVVSVIVNWKGIAKDIGISRAEQELMEKAFNP